MSPSDAAPRIASVAAWQTTSASEWPSAPTVATESVDAAEHERPALDQPVQVVADARPASAGRVGSRSHAPRAPSRSSAVVIFTFAAIALDDVHGVAGALGQRRLVGRLDAGPPERDRVPRARRAETPAASAPGRSSRAEASRRSRQPIPVAATRLTVSLTGSAAIAAPCAAAASIAARSTSRVTNGRAASCTSTISVSRPTASNAFATESCRRAPPATTRTRPRAVEPRRRRVGTELGRQRDDHVVDRRMRCERVDAALQDRSCRRRRATASARRRRAGGRRRRPR